jgi:hypothetical protein
MNSTLCGDVPLLPRLKDLNNLVSLFALLPGARSLSPTLAMKALS